jgi:phage terminase small subunit
MKKGLSPKQTVFVDEYLVDLNATQAATRAGYSKKTAFRIGAENLQKPAIQAAIQTAMAKREKRTGITQDRVLQEYARIAFFDVRKLVSADGKPLSLQDLDEDTARAVVGIDVVRIPGEDGAPPGEVLKFKLADKKGALDSCARHLGMFERDNNQSNPGDKMAAFISGLVNANAKLTLPSKKEDGEK